MYPEPRRYISPVQKRLSVGRRAVTVCIAGVNQHPESPVSIFTVSDRKVSWGDMFSAEGMAWKLRTIHAKWRVMFAGPNSSAVALVDAIKTSAANAKENRLRSFAKVCSRAYREERQRIIESDILTDYDIESYAEYRVLKLSDRQFFDELTKEIKRVEAEWKLLFLGFDESDQPHIFTITECGKVTYCDIQGCAAIGTGATIAYIGLARVGFNRYMKRGEAMYSLLSAKFEAEKSAEGIGEETIFLTFKPTDRPGRSVPGIQPKGIEKVREKWKSLPTIPEGIADTLASDLDFTEKHEGRQKIGDPLKGFSKRSTSRKSKPV